MDNYRKGSLEQPRRNPLLPIITLANWQVKQTWRLLIVTAIGMIAAVVLVCAVPLYSRVALSAGLRSLISANDTNSTLMVAGTQIHAGITDSIDQVDQTVQQDMGDDVIQTPDLITHIQGPARGGLSEGLLIIQPNSSWQYLNDLPGTGNTQPQIQMEAFNQGPLPDHVTIDQGHLPTADASGVIEIAVLKSAASCFYAISNKCVPVKVGDTISVVSPFTATTTDPAPDPGAPPQQHVHILPWKLYVVGLFTPKKVTDPFWHNRTFDSVRQDPQSQVYPSMGTALVMNEEMTPLLDHLPVPPASLKIPQPQPGSPSPVSFISGAASVYWHFKFNTANLEADHLDDLITEISTTESDVKLNNTGVQIDTVVDPIDTLKQYNTRLALAEMPVDLLLIIVTGMVLLFLSVSIELLVERQTDVIAVLRSRGASRRQIFSVFTAQSAVMAVLVLIIGPLLAIPVALLLVKTIFTASDMGASSLLTSDPISAAWNIRGYALIALAATLLVTLFTLFRATSLDVLALRRQTARTTRPSIWERFYLDGVLAVLALGGYGYTLYAINTGVLDPITSVELLSPLVLISSTVFLLAVVLLFLRFFPRIAQWAAHLAARRKGATSMLALAQIARSPRQAQRIILLLTLTTALAIFALIFSASQAQRITDVVDYQVGSDFSAWLNQSIPFFAAPDPKLLDIGTQTAKFQSIHGVSSASVGLVNTVHVQDTAIIVKAVDAKTFPQTVIWKPQYSSDSISTLMQDLVNRRQAAINSHRIPVIVDAETWKALSLSEGETFSVLWDATNRLDCVAIKEVQHIPTTNTTVSASNFTSKSILLDYQTLNAVYNSVAQQPITPLIPNYVWLRTVPGTSAQSIHAALQKHVQDGTVIFDRQAFITSMQQDPVTLNLIGAFAIGTVTPLLLALLGSLLVSWLNARNRLLSFSVLRALGTSPGQIAGVISWEQGFVYLLMLAMGVLAGIILAVMVLPSLILTSVVITGSDGNVSSNPALQGSLPALQMILPVSLFIVLGLLVVICFMALSAMIRIVSKPSLSQTLRLNAD